ncbi:MAG: arginine--tRNA ligase [Actinomycetota bacterium]|nr:arginine--tRNA ligase [Actinomycetota bacterium]
MRAAVRAAVGRGDLAITVPERVTVERPKVRAHGDYATNVALQVAKGAGRPPREVAELIAAELRQHAEVKAVDVAGPGFLNITLAGDALGGIARTVVDAGQAYGRTNELAGQRINLEFVSANPTGPIHLGHTRWAAVGDALGRLLTASGAEVTREFYINDAGAQISRFAASLYAAAIGEQTPSNGYVGAYIADIAAQVVARHPDVDLSSRAAVDVFRREGVPLMLEDIKSALAGFGVVFDVYFSEKDLHDKGELDSALKRLRDQGHVYEAEGAVWLRSTDFGDDKDRPLVKSNGEWTYIAADAAYYLDKRERGFDKVVIMLGADHHGYVRRYRAMAAAYGDDPDQTLEILIGQMVTLTRGGEPVKMSKRAGNIVALEDLVDAVGVDAGRYALARSSTDSQIDIDLDLWTRATNDNPVFYVQYAHARIASLLRNASDLGLHRDPDADLGLLETRPESDLLRALGEFPRVVAGAAELRAPHRVARYLEELAGTYHRFYDSSRVLPYGDDPAVPLTFARLELVEATRVVLANGLALLGVSAPERM